MALLALTARGPLETPFLVEEVRSFELHFGGVTPGMLGALAADGVFSNGGQRLIVARFAPPGAGRASASLDVLGLSGGPTSHALSLSTRDPGSFGNDVEVEISLTSRAFASGSVVGEGALGSLSRPLAAHVGCPARLLGPSGERWVVVTSASGTGATFTPGAPGVLGSVLIDVFEPTFSVRAREPGRPDRLVRGLSLGDLPGARARLQAAGLDLVFTGPEPTGLELPRPSVLALSGGSDGLDVSDVDDPAAIEAMTQSFLRALSALEQSDLPDVLVAPDLWSRTWRSHGTKRLAFDPATAERLADRVVLSAARSGERVALVDAPLTGPSALRPAGVSELESWQTRRAIELADARDFAGALSPWLRVPVGASFRGDDTLLLPPSAHVAGRMAERARERGPWVATGNVALERAVGLSSLLSLDDEARLQQAGICPVRQVMPSGSSVQGVRSMSYPDRPAWGFLSTRRLFNALRRALRPIGLSYCFEPNEPATWVSLRRDLTRLLRDLFDRGALAGARPEQAFFVRVDESINPPEARESGQLNALVGVAPAAPLEFLVVRLVTERDAARVVEEQP